MPFEPIPPRRLFRRIAEQIAAMITQGELAIGSRLPAERDLAERLKVSRPSLREALIALEIEGLVEVRGGSGVYVRDGRAGAPPSAPDAPGPFDVLGARLAVEPECAALAARQAAPSGREAVAGAFARLRAAHAARRTDHEADRGFHIAIAEASGNPVLARIVAGLWLDQSTPLSERLEDLAVAPARRRENLGEHRAIADAILAGDAAAARAAMRRHLVAVRRGRLAALRSGRAVHRP